MKLDFNLYQDNYHTASNFVDNWQSGIKTLPFVSNTSSMFDKKCGLQGTVGELYRLISNDGSKPISDFQSSVADPVKEYLEKEKNMDSKQADVFVDVLTDILQIEGNINVTDPTLFKFLPVVPQDVFSLKYEKKYASGQRKIAEYILSMFDKIPVLDNFTENNNLFIRLLKEALAINSSEKYGAVNNSTYSILPFVKEAFNKDYEWMKSAKDSTKIKYLHLFVHFFLCFSVIQTICNLNAKKYNTNNLVPFYFILDEEPASRDCDAVLSWNTNIPKSSLEYIYGRSQALDIVNSLLGGKIGFYPKVLEALKETPFLENRQVCCDVLQKYQDEKWELIKKRDSEKRSSYDKIDINVESYEDFLVKLEKICVDLQSVSYQSRMKKKITDLLSVKFLQNRRGNNVLVLDKEMLIFLIALFTKEKKTKLEKMYQLFGSYGIRFNRNTKVLIESYLLKLGLLDRKSDSGEAQYVEVIL